MDIQVIRSSYVPKKGYFSVIFPTGHSPELVRPVLHPLPSPHARTHVSLARRFISRRHRHPDSLVPHYIIIFTAIPVSIVRRRRRLNAARAKALEVVDDGEGAGLTESGSLCFRRVFHSVHRKKKTTNNNNTTTTTTTTTKRKRNTRGQLNAAAASNNNGPYNQPVTTAPGDGNNNNNIK